MRVISRDDSSLEALRKKLAEMPVAVKRPKRPIRVSEPSDFSAEDDFFTAPPKDFQPTPKPKPTLNCNDMFFLYKRLWRENGFPGNCPAWTGRERKHFKDLIAEQGEEAVTVYLKYSLSNWKELCHRYRIMSVCPTVAILFGFRKNLLPEALDPSKKPTHGGAEYTETDIPSGSWG